MKKLVCLMLMVGVGGLAQAALMRVDAENGMDLAHFINAATTADTEPHPPSGSANIYASTDGGTTWLNHGNSYADLAYDFAITDGAVLELYFQNWGAAADGPGDTDIRGLTIIGADGVTEVFKAGVLNSSNGLVSGTPIVEGTAATFTDTDGQMWQIDYDFTSGGAGADIVGNLGIIGVDDASTYYNPAGDVHDHLATLTFTAVPEPATMGLLALGGLMLRRKR